jgi:glyoxylase-like metal-dependent hydrolase (beta-lactamase superfamily II)
MQRWQIGDVTVTKVFETWLRSDASLGLGISSSDIDPYRDWMRPYLGPDDDLPTSVHTFCIEADGTKMIIDTGIGNDMPYGSEVMQKSLNGLQTTFLTDLATAGFGQDDVDVVVCTHLHQDHVGNNTVRDESGIWRPTFRNAKYMISRRDYALWEAGFTKIPEFVADDRLSFDMSIAPLAAAGQIEQVDPETTRITSTVSLVPTPGHTPDHMSVCIESGGKTGFITGDLVHSPLQLARPECGSAVDADPEQSEQSRYKLVKMAQDRDALVLGTHFPGKSAGFLRGSGASLRFEPAPSFQ